MKSAVLGIDIGGTNTVIGLVTREGIVIEQCAISTQTHEKFDDYVQELATIVQTYKDKFPTYSIEGIGIGAPDGNFLTGNIEHAVNLIWKGVIPIAQKVSLATGLPVKLTNDANAAALGEMLFGGAQGIKNFAVITLGTGLGGGIVVEGKLLYGYSGHAGEPGHITLVPDGRVCGCGARGCVETYVSATGIVRTTLSLLSEYMTPSTLRLLPVKDITSKAIFLAAQDNDSIAIEAFSRTAGYLGRSMAMLTTILSPEAIFLFGGLAKSGNMLLLPAQKAFEDALMPMYKGTCKILPSSLPESDAAVLGAAALIWESLDKREAS